MGRAGARARWAVAATALVAAWPDARADGLSLTVEPSYTLTTVEARDQIGTTTRLDTGTLGQAYRLNFDRQLGSALFAGVGGQLQDRRSWTGDGTPTESLERCGFARLTL